MARTITLRPRGSIEEGDAVYPMPLPLQFTKIAGYRDLQTDRQVTMSAMDFKMLIVLLKLEYDRLEELSGNGKFHEVSRRKMLLLFKKYSGTKDDELLFESLKRLAKFIVEFHYVDKDKREIVEGITSLLELQRRTDEDDEEKQYFRFRFADGLVPILINPQLFSILRVSLILEMRSKYTIALYQILVRHAEMKYQPYIEAGIEEWREWLKVPISDKKNSPWRSFTAFRQKVLEVAIGELNQKSKLTGFKVTYKTKKRGRGGAVERIRFEVSEEKKENELIKGDIDFTDSKNIVLFNQTDAKDILTYFEKVRNNSDIEPNKLSSKDLIKAIQFLDDLESLERAKELIDVICTFDNRPDFFGGLFKHKARGIAELEKRKQRKLSETLKQKQQEEAKNELLNQRSACLRQFESYFDSLTKQEISIIEEEICDNLNQFELKYFKNQPSTGFGKEFRRYHLFQWWLNNKSNLEKSTVKDLLKFG